MNGGEISGNNAYSSTGGGVYVEDGGTFSMYGNNSKISGNKASSGGGVRVDYGGTFTMHGGTISGNTAYSTEGGGGGGVYVYNNANSIFRMVTGTIYGSEADESLRNTTGTSGAALFKGPNGIATYGPSGTGTNLTTTDNTIRVVEGV
jgi:hypothetical protein